MIAKLKAKRSALALLLLAFCFGQAQDSTQVSEQNLKYLDFYDYRGTNTFTTGIGTSVINGDFEDPLFEIYFKAGYRRFFTPHFGASLSYHKFNLAYDEVFNQGYMSFDLNLEYLLLPHKRFSPYIFGGAGYNASNYFEDTATKVQVGGGIEYIVGDGFGLSLFTDYNYVFDDTLDGLEAGASDDTYFRIGFGLHFYFGGQKKKENIYGSQKTVINSNLLVKPKDSKVTK